VSLKNKSEANMFRKSTLFTLFALMVFCIQYPPLMGSENDIHQEVNKAKAKLQEGINSWNVEKIRSAKDMFLNLLLKEDSENVYFHYYIALCDYRLVTYEMSENLTEEAGRNTVDAQKHLKKVMELKPTWGEPFALYASTVGLEIALDWNKAMSLSSEIYEYFGKAYDLDPKNPRINLLKGSSDLYTPVEYGGGPDVAIGTLSHAVELFEEENVQNPLEPSWGKEEALTFLGIAYQQKGNNSKARELFLKALEINPEFGLAIDSLEQLKK